MSDCLDDSTTFDFVMGTLAPDAEARAKAHLDTCEDCRSIVSATRKSMREESPDGHDPNALPQGGVIGRYRVLDVIGTGAMGVVYAAYDPELDRRVAMKLLRANLDMEERVVDLQQRLSREARAMARLSHENVVAVYDTGTFDGRVFLAMELVDGVSLSAWLKASPRTWQEVLLLYVSAGRGLAAAHQAGLVHRDFKPDNVLVGRDGRVRVTDFGLARPVIPLPPESVQALHTLARASMQDLSAVSTETTASGEETQAGVVAGTPAYMAPEQLLGKAADERSDQFSFAVALYEGLYGTRPFSGGTIDELVREILSQRVNEPPKDSRVPAWLRRVLLRGLSTAPQDRYPSMAELLTALERHTWRMRRRVVIPGALLFAIATALLGYRVAARQRPPVCTGAESRLTGVWDAPRKHDAEAAFRATGAPYASDAWSNSARVVDAYTQAWIRMRTDACEATRVRAEQSEQVLDLRVACLDDRLRTVAAVTKLFSEADAKVAERAVESAQSLPPLDICANVAALRSGVAPPRDAETAKRAADVRGVIADGSALERAGKYKEALVVADTALTQARSLEYLPVEAEALHLQGLIQGGLDDSKTALSTLQEAAAVAETASHHEVAAHAFIDLAYFVGYRDSRFAEGDRWLRYAGVAIDRIGGNAVLDAERSERLGLLQWSEGKTDDATKSLERALGLFEKHLGPADTMVAKTLDAMAVVAFDLGDYEGSRELDTRAIAIDEKAYGLVHPAVAYDLNNRANALSRLDRYDEALVDLRRSLDVLERTLGPDHSDMFLVEDSLGTVLTSLGELDEALAVLKRARAVLDKVGGKTDLPDYASVLNDTGQVLREQKSYAEALVDHRQALAVLEKALGPAHPDVAMTHRAIAETLLAQGKPREALDAAKRALPDPTLALGGEASNTAKVLTVMGEATLGLGDASTARALLERALASREKLRGEVAELARTRFALARALPADERPRARALAAEAQQTYLSKPYFKAKLAAVDAWLAKP